MFKRTLMNTFTCEVEDKVEDKVEDNDIKDEDDNDSDKKLKYQLHDDCQTVLTWDPGWSPIAFRILPIASPLIFCGDKGKEMCPTKTHWSKFLQSVFPLL